ncbi:hypothetical protein TELCIR_04949 [Teladorsagia circumcincta]|uniref:SCP domain-containing protein n=1 Tax=Teladorsagia circumcincta TaxID=45464 RepID=A0A2G9US47_TELCI|nr:hypothetical protein TELCIR_04949 [Teladorsagia circumcincta]
MQKRTSSSNHEDKSPAPLEKAQPSFFGWVFRLIKNAHEYCQNHGNFMDDDTRTKILHFHNGLRYALAQGTSPGHEGKTLPPAKNLYKMSWSCALEEKSAEANQKLFSFRQRILG